MNNGIFYHPSAGHWHLRPRVLSLALWLALPLCAQTQQALTLNQAQELSRQRSMQLLAQDAAGKAAQHLAVSAAQLPDPTLKLGLNNLPLNGADRFSVSRDFMTMRSLGVMQEFTREDKRRFRSARFTQEAEVAASSRVLALTQLQRDTATAWFDRYYLEQQQPLLSRLRDEAALQVAAADAAYQGGRGSQAEVFSTRLYAAQIDDRVAQSLSQLNSAKIQLSRWVGEAGTAPLAAPPDTSQVQLDPGDLNSHPEHHPQLAVLTRQEAIADTEVQLAQANKRADWTLELMVNQRGPAFSNMASINLSLPWQWDQSNRQEQELAAKLAARTQLGAQREEATRMVVAQAQSMLQEWQNKRSRLNRFETTLLPLSAERKRAALAAYSGGTSPLSAVLEARRMELDAQLEHIQLKMETARLWAQLNYLIPAALNTSATRMKDAP